MINVIRPVNGSYVERVTRRAVMKGSFCNVEYGELLAVCFHVWLYAAIEAGGLP